MVMLSEVVSPAPIEIWQEVLAADQTAMVTQSPAWLAAICDTSPYADASRLFRFSDGRRVVLPLARHRRLARGWSLEGSWPHDWGLSGPLGDGPVTGEHTRQVYEHLLAEPALRRSIRIDPRADPSWSIDPPGYVRAQHFTQIVDLSGGYEQVWNSRFRASVRRAVRKADASGVVVEADTSGRLTPVFCRLYHQSIRRWAHQQNEPWMLARARANHDNPPRKFAAVARRLGTACTTWVAWHRGVPVASILVLSNGRHARYWRGAMDADLASPVRANDLLHSRAIEWACETGHSSYYMGDSRPDSGLARFKAGFGATPYHSVGYLSERLPLSDVESRARATVKRVIGFRDV